MAVAAAYGFQSYGESRLHWYCARQVCAMFIDAMRSGWVKRIKPSCSQSLDPTYIHRVCSGIDQAWEDEWWKRTRRWDHVTQTNKPGDYTGPPGFSSLEDEQQLALVELLRIALGKSPGSLDCVRPWLSDVPTELLAKLPPAKPWPLDGSVSLDTTHAEGVAY